MTQLFSPAHQKMADGLRVKYDANRHAPVGSDMNCPVCNRMLVKKTYHQVFCGKKKRDRSNCKDQYHNITNPRGLERGFSK